MDRKLETHLVQSPEWGEFKSKMGTPGVSVGDIQFTKHPLPVLPFYVGYAPRVNFFTQKFSWVELKAIAKQEKCAFIRFDVPNVLKSDAKKASNIILEIKDKCRKSPRSTFAKWNVVLDLDKPDDELIAAFSSKSRYNSKLAAKKGVIVKVANDEKGLSDFIKLLRETAKRQKFLMHSDDYYVNAYNIFRSLGRANILTAYYKDQPLASWMLFNQGETLYYPYGGSSTENRNLMASNLLAWEAIRLGKRLGCKTFDMWGATNDKNDPWWGFTNFKLGYGGELIEYMNSYDFVINKPLYFAFNLAYNSFWKFRNLLNRSK